MYHDFVRKSSEPVRILMIAPEPFFEPRGTPFSEFHRIRALTGMNANDLEFLLRYELAFLIEALIE